MYENKNEAIPLSNLEEWKKCSRSVIGQVDKLTSAEFSHTLYICARWNFVDLEQLQALMRWGSQPENIAQFTWLEIAYIARGLGLFAQEAHCHGNEDVIEFLHEKAKPFLCNLLSMFFKDKALTAHKTVISPLGSVVRGIGSLFRGDLREEITLHMDTLIMMLAQNYNSQASQRPYVDLLKGCRYYGYSNPAILDQVAASILTTLQKDRSFEYDTGNVLLDIGWLGIKNEGLNELLAIDFVFSMPGLTLKNLLRGVHGFSLLSGISLDEIKAVEDNLITCHVGFSNAQLISCIYALSSPNKWSPSVVNVMVREACKPDRLNTFTQQDLHTLLGSLAFVKLGDMDILEKLAMKLVSDAHTTGVSPLLLSRAAWAFGKLQFHHQPFFMLLRAELMKTGNLVGFCDQDISRVLIAYAKLRFRDNDVLNALSVEIMKPERLRKFTEQSLANILWAFSALSYRNEKCLLATGQELCSSYRQPFERGHHAAMSFKSYGSLKIFNFEILRYWIHVATKQAQSYSSWDLCDILHGLSPLASMGLGALDREVAAFLNVSSQIFLSRRFTDQPVQAWMRMLRGYSRLKYLDKRILDACIDHTDSVLPEERSRWVSHIRNTCAWLNYQRKGLPVFQQANCEQNFGHGIGTMTEEMFTRSITGELSVNDFEECCRKLMEHKSNRATMTTTQWWKFIQSWMAITILQGYSVDSPHCASLIEEGKQACLTVQNTLKSNFSDSVKLKLRYNRVPLSQEKAVFNGLIPVNIMVMYDPPVVIECDGPGQYTINSIDGCPILLGKAVLRKKLLEALGYKVFSSYFRFFIACFEEEWCPHLHCSSIFSDRKGSTPSLITLPLQRTSAII